MAFVISNIYNNSKTLREDIPSGSVVGYISGVFDLLHRGHKEFLNLAKRQCDFLVVSVVSDEHARVRKGPDRPYESRLIRAFKVSAHKDVDAVVVMDHVWHEADERWTTSPEEYLPLKADIAFFGCDYNPQNLRPDKYLLARKIVFIKNDFEMHTTQIIEEMRRRDNVKHPNQQASSHYHPQSGPQSPHQAHTPS